MEPEHSGGGAKYSNKINSRALHPEFIPEVEDVVAFGVAGVMVMQVGVGAPDFAPVAASFVIISGHLFRG